jgi:hypothetical protein
METASSDEPMQASVFSNELEAAMNLADTRRALHAVAELVLAGPQYAASAEIKLTSTPGGFATVTAPDVRVHGTDVIAGQSRAAISGCSAVDLAAALGLTARTLDDVYSEGSGVGLDEPLTVDPDGAAVLAAAFAAGDTALRAFAPAEEPVLWPEHFDIGSTVDEVNYGVSPGDGYLAEPYMYVGPWTPRTGEFWNAPFGAARALGPVPDPALIVAFFEQGRAASRA